MAKANLYIEWKKNCHKWSFPKIIAIPVLLFIIYIYYYLMSSAYLILGHFLIAGSPLQFNLE